MKKIKLKENAEEIAVEKVKGVDNEQLPNLQEIRDADLITILGTLLLMADNGTAVRLDEFFDEVKRRARISMYAVFLNEGMAEIVEE